MLKAHKLIFAGLLLLSLHCVFAAEISSSPKEPDHLVPLDPFPFTERTRYKNELWQRLKLTDFYFSLQMLVKPAFTGEYVVRLQGDNPESLLLADSTNAKLYYAVASRSINSFVSETDRGEKAADVTAAFITVEFPKSLGERILKLWERMMMRVRYSDYVNQQSDGSVYEFATFTTTFRYGEMASADSRLSPSLLADLGHSLIDYCKSAPNGRPAVLRKIEMQAADLERYLDEHPVSQ